VPAIPPLSREHAAGSYGGNGEHGLTSSFADRFRVGIQAGTEENQAAHPQSSSQKAGLGFPICRLVELLCLGRWALLDAAMGPCERKGNNEQLLLREMPRGLECICLALHTNYHLAFTVTEIRPVSTSNNLFTLGWREWMALPAIGIKRIKAKVDTGARTSCLHAFFVETYRHKGADRVRFGVHPHQKDSERFIICDADLVDRRMVSDSGGHRERRCVIETDAVIGNRRQRIEFSLMNRDSMRFRILLGRTAMAGIYCVDPGASYRAGKPLADGPDQTQHKASPGKGQPRER